MRFEHVCVPSPDWLVGVLAPENCWMVGPWRQWRHLERRVRRVRTWTKEVRSSSVVVDPVVLMVAWRGRTQLGACECVTVVHIIVIWYILCSLLY